MELRERGSGRRVEIMLQTEEWHIERECGMGVEIMLQT